MATDGCSYEVVLQPLASAPRAHLHERCIQRLTATTPIARRHPVAAPAYEARPSLPNQIGSSTFDGDVHSRVVTRRSARSFHSRRHDTSALLTGSSNFDVANVTGDSTRQAIIERRNVPVARSVAQPAADRCTRREETSTINRACRSARTALGKRSTVQVVSNNRVLPHTGARARGAAQRRPRSSALTSRLAETTMREWRVELTNQLQELLRHTDELDAAIGRCRTQMMNEVPWTARCGAA